MADINLKVTGNADGAKQALGDTADAVGKSTVKFTELANAAKAVAKEIGAFLQDSLKQYAESDRIQRQLIRSAGEYADIIDQQSKALAKLYAVDDDVINQSAILLSQWGGAGAAAKENEIAVLNLASAMGTDLKSATEQLIRNVESGGTGLAKMGIHFQQTGDKGKDLAAAVAAINAKLSGSAEADAKSLEGGLHAASIAFDDLKKGIGQNIANLLEASGAVGLLTDALRGMSEFFTQEETKRLGEKAYKTAELATATKELQLAQEALNDAQMDPNTSISVLELFADDVARATARLDSLKEVTKELPPVIGETNKGMKDAAQAAKEAAEYEEKLDEEASALIETLRQQTEEWEKNNAAIVGSMDGFKNYVSNTKLVSDSIRNSMPLYNKVYEAWQTNDLKQQQKRDEAVAKMLAKSNEDNLRATKQQADQWAHTGDQIGAAFVNALSDQLSKLAEGGEFDAVAFLGDILAATAGIAATAIGTYFGAPAIGAAVGNLAATGIRAGFAGLSASEKRKGSSRRPLGAYHDGGWVGAPRHHDGSWIGADEERAILQTGERVASRAEVQNAGGHAALDRTLKGMPSVVVQIQAIDSKSAADSFVSNLGSGMKQALRRGQGALPSLLGMGPR